ncbi:hypothetical protein GIB67_028178 [Kingdonia uniflora]|uniref:Zinc finger CHCC-type domain-containing protein n=1 Tax=Kingdonia uniflora TaxID=39325 RepID=A0A7J7KZS8_9MAGN|nr:hypothetical protein GIB67_028178 [Kingdonia uniflora]
MSVIDFPPMTPTIQPFKVYSRRPRAHPAPVRSALGNTPSSDLLVIVSNDTLVTVDIPVSNDTFLVIPPDSDPALGHPIEFICLDLKDPAICKYCGLRYVQHDHHH